MTDMGTGQAHPRPRGGPRRWHRLCALALAILLATVSGCPSARAQGWAGASEPSPAPLTGHTGLLDEDVAGADQSAGALLLDLSWKLGLVLILAYGALWTARRGVSVRRGPGGQGLQVMETVSLGGQRSLHLVRVGRRVLLVGATAQQLCTLAQVEGTDLVTETEAEGQLGGLQTLPSSPALDSLPTTARRAVRGLRRLWAASPVGE